MNTAAPFELPDFTARWRFRTPQVRKALLYIKRRGGHVTADELVAWDEKQPAAQRLFTWDDDKAAAEYRLTQARWFLNRFRARFDGLRVRAFMHIHKDDDADITDDAYFTVQTISEHPGMRAQVIRDITRRMASLAAELKLWNLSEQERALVIDCVQAALDGTQRKTA